LCPVSSQRGVFSVEAPPSGRISTSSCRFIMAATLIVGVFAAKQKCYKAHGIRQTTVLLLNSVMIGLVMWPSFHQHVEPAPSTGLHKRYYQTAILHAALGIAARILGLYIVMVAGTNFVPQFLRFTHWKWWMREEFGLWGQPYSVAWERTAHGNGI
jgi:uncharacterized membrane protein YozB (DUF420 family)